MGQETGTRNRNGMAGERDRGKGQATVGQWTRDIRTGGRRQGKIERRQGKVDIRQGKEDRRQGKGSQKTGEREQDRWDRG